MRGEAGTTSPPPKVGGACRGSKSAPKQAFSVAFGAREPCLSVSQRQAVWPRALLRLLGFNQVPRVPVQPMPFSSACSRFRFRSSFSLPRQHSEGACRRTQPLASLRDKFYWELRFFFNPLSPSSLFPHLLLALCFALQCVKKIIKMQLMCKKMSLTFQVILKKFAIIFDRCAMRQNKHKDKTRTTELVMTIINDKSFTTHPISHP